MNSMNDKKWLLIIDSPHELAFQCTSVLNCPYSLKFIRIGIDDILSVQFCRVDRKSEEFVLNSFQATSKEWLNRVCMVDSGMLTVINIHDFNAHSLSELFVKLDLGGYFYDEPSIAP